MYKLFCSSCRNEVSLKRSILNNQIRSQKHQKGKKQTKAKGKRERIIFEKLKKYNEENHIRGETLPEEQQLYRVIVVSAFLRARVHASKQD